MEVIFILGAFQSFFLALLLYRKRNKLPADLVLATWLIFIGLHLLYHYLFDTGFLHRHPHLLQTGSGLYLLDGPFAFVYVLIMISKHGKFRAVYLLHTLPFILLSLYQTFEFYILNAAEKLEYIEMLYTNPPRDFLIITLPTILIGPAYVIWALVKLKKHRINISNDFSFTEKIDLKWLRIVLLSLGLVWVTGIISNILVRFSFFSIPMHEDLNYFAYVIAVFFIGYFGIRQKNIYSDVVFGDNKNSGLRLEKSPSEPRYQNSGLKHDEAEGYLKKLIEYFETEKPYLDGELVLRDVADHLGLSVNHVSQVINSQLGRNFFDFVNAYRVDEVKSMIAEEKHKQLTLLAIAYESGFNSKSSFNNIFKRMTGQTPSQYTNSLNSTSQ